MLFPSGIELRYRGLLLGLWSDWLAELKRDLPAMLEAEMRTDAKGDLSVRLRGTGFLSKQPPRQFGAKLRAKLEQMLESKSIDVKIGDVANGLSKFNRVQIEKSLGTKVHSEAFAEKMKGHFIQSNVNLITNMSEEHIAKVQSIVDRGVASGARHETVAKQIYKSVDVSKARARLIARDQIAKLNADMTRLRQESVGVTKYEWQTAGDQRVRATHKANNGKIFRWDKPPKKTGHPGDDINCRCQAIAVVAF